MVRKNKRNMKIKAKIIFLMALGTLLLAFPVARAATANASTNAASADTGTNVNLNATMTALFGNPVIARGKGFEIKQSDLDEVMTGIKSGGGHAQPGHSSGANETD